MTEHKAGETTGLQRIMLKEASKFDLKTPDGARDFLSSAWMAGVVNFDPEHWRARDLPDDIAIKSAELTLDGIKRKVKTTVHL